MQALLVGAGIALILASIVGGNNGETSTGSTVDSTSELSTSGAIASISITEKHTSCDADNCAGQPISYEIERSNQGVPVSIALTDPNRREVAPGEGGNDDPSAWTWAAAYDDPVGAYTVTFSTGEGGDVVKTFTVAPIEGPFGVVQRLADAVAHEDWNGAASIDRRIAADLATLGELKLANEYTVFTD